MTGGADDGDGAVETLRRCRGCGGADLGTVLSLGRMPLANAYLDAGTALADEPRYPLELTFCRGCSLVALGHVVRGDVLFRDYSYVSTEAPVMSAHMDWVADFCIERLGLAPGDTVLEFGSNVGLQLERFAQRGMRVVGVDPARNIGVLADRAGVPTEVAFFGEESGRELRGRYGPARLVLGRHVFAHVHDLDDVLAGARRVMAPGGSLVVEVHYVLDLIAGCQFDTIYHEHLSYFSVATLSVLLRRHGLRLVEAERVGVHGGSLLVAATADETREPSPSVAERLAEEAAAGLGSEQTYTAFAARVAQVTGAVRATIADLRGRSVRVAGYGAPAKGSTLLNACRLGPDDLEFCSDTSALKQGKLLPGTGIPVRSPEDAAQRPPDVYLMLAWNFAQDIVEREGEFLARGGRFLVPIPEPRFVTDPRVSRGTGEEAPTNP